jgi:predicted transcriptional regulator
MIIKSQRIKKALLIALADDDMIKIMNSVMNNSKSFNEIVTENNTISRTTAFRKLKWLLKEGLIIVDRIVLAPDGRKFSLYHSTLKAIAAKYESTNIYVEAEPNFDITKKWIEKFFSLD